MGRRRKVAIWMLFATNVLDLTVFAFSWGLSDTLETNARSNYAYVENAGAIDANGLTRLPDREFATDPHGTFFSRVAGRALAVQRTNAQSSLLMAASNLAWAIAFLVPEKRIDRGS